MRYEPATPDALFMLVGRAIERAVVPPLAVARLEETFIATLEPGSDPAELVRACNYFWDCVLQHPPTIEPCLF